MKGIQLPLTNEEAELYDRFDDYKTITRKDLSQREVFLASNLVNKNVLTRKKQNGKITYTRSKHS